MGIKEPICYDCGHDIMLHGVYCRGRDCKCNKNFNELIQDWRERENLKEDLFQPSEELEEIQEIC